MGQAQQQNRFTIALMPNIASVLKAEIVRVARKEVRNEIAGLRKSAAAYRSEIAALKRRTQTLELELRRLNKSVPKRSENPVLETTATKVRFSAKGLVTLRQRLALSAHELGLLVGASGQSVYNWETGEVRPRDKHLPLIAALKGMGKKEVASLLADAQRAAT